MTERTLIRKDDYYAPSRPVYIYSLIDPTQLDINGDPLPFDMTGSTIRATFKVAPTDITADPTDTGAPIKADIVFSGAGAITSSTNFALAAGKTAADGELMLVLDKVATAALPLTDTLKSDIQVTDAAGRNHTVILIGTLSAIDGYTNRS